jgi:hypothetical protein
VSQADANECSSQKEEQYAPRKNLTVPQGLQSPQKLWGNGEAHVDDRGMHYEFELPIHSKGIVIIVRKMYKRVNANGIVNSHPFLGGFNRLNKN